MGLMEKKMEPTTMGYIGPKPAIPKPPIGGFPKLGVLTIMENQMETKMENEMETGII